jgi:hypothetical protein
MLLEQLPGFLTGHWDLAVTAAIGVGVASVALLVGRFILRRPTGAGHEIDVLESKEFDPFVHGSKMERRGSARRPGNPVEVVVGDARGQTELAHAWVVDRSMGGLCLVADVPLEETQIVTVKPASSPANVFWTQVEIRSCRNSGGKSFEIGCKFVKTPSWNQLLYFG